MLVRGVVDRLRFLAGRHGRESFLLLNDRVSEEHVYFPEWADRPPATGSLHEADRNSYLAGGYAEEFGHRALLERAAAAAIPAEEDGEWRVQAGCLHPGYPECPRPLDRELQADGGKVGPDGRPRRPQPAQRPKREPVAFKVILIGHGQESGSRRRFWDPWRELRIRRLRLPLG